MNPQKKLVMIVDDDYAAAAALRDALENAGYEATVALGALAGLAFAGLRKPHVVIAATVLNGADGIGFMKALAVRAETAHIPVILKGENSRAGESSVAMAYGAAAFIGRDNPPEELDSVIRWVLTGIRGPVVEAVKA